MQFSSLRGGLSIEIIAVNDASPDDTMENLNSYRDPRLRIIDRRVTRAISLPSMKVWLHLLESMFAELIGR